MNKWKGKVALVSGASAGIGADISKVLVREGCIVFGIARRLEKLQEVSKCVEGSQGSFHPLKCDVREPSEVEAVFKTIKDKYGGVDICICNAGLGSRHSLIDGNVSEWKTVMETNVISTCQMAQLGIKSMTARNVVGHVIIINSTAGHQIMNINKGTIHFYTASKYAVTALAEGFRQELREMKSQIRITSISPGLVETEFAMGSRGISSDELKKFYQNQNALQCEDISKIILNVLSSNPRVEINDVLVRSIG